LFAACLALPNRVATAAARSASSMMLERSNIERVRQAHRFMISPSDKPARKSRAASAQVMHQHPAQPGALG